MSVAQVKRRECERCGQLLGDSEGQLCNICISETSPPTEGSGANISLQYVTSSIAKRAAKFESVYGVKPFDVVLGPKEFAVLAEQAGLPDTHPSSQYRFELAQYFYKGMRIRLAQCDGIMVGCLTAREDL